MPKRVSMVLLLVVFAAAAASASDEAIAPVWCAPLARLGRAREAHTTRAARETKPSEVPYGGVEVLVARIGPDGKVIIACVDSAEAAKRFLEAPIEKVARQAAPEK